MGIEKNLEKIGIRGNVGLASLQCSNNLDQIMEAWDTGVGFIVLKTMMFSEDRPGEHLVKEIQIVDDNTTFYHSGTTSKEQHNFQDDEQKIVEFINSLYSAGIAIIPSIGAKETNTEPWEIMERTLAKTEARVVELNLRYLYRSLLNKHKGIKSNEYRVFDPKGVAEDENKAIYLANRELGELLGIIREIFPRDKYSLVPKLWSCHEMKLHLMYVAQSGYDAVTLVNSIKREPPEPFEKIPEGKMPQMSGLRLRRNRDYALELAKNMGYELPIFASGGVAIEAIKDINFDGLSLSEREALLQKNFHDAMMDIKKCFELGASYAQLGSVGYIRGPYGNSFNTIRKIIGELKPSKK